MLMVLFEKAFQAFVWPSLLIDADTNTSLIRLSLVLLRESLERDLKPQLRTI
jgi:hypothetical protein